MILNRALPIILLLVAQNYIIIYSAINIIIYSIVNMFFLFVCFKINIELGQLHLSDIHEMQAG